MGYYTKYDLTDLTEDQVEAVNEVSGYSFTNRYTSDDVKWYDCEKDMKKVSHVP